MSPATEDCLQLLAQSGFDYVIIETVGTGQEAMPFQSKLVDQTVLVMNPDYGARLQLQKIVMLDLADIVVVNKSDLDRAQDGDERNRAAAWSRTARAEVARDGGETAPRPRGGSIMRFVDAANGAMRTPKKGQTDEQTRTRG